MSKIEFLDHLAIQVRDPEKTADWYCDLLGLERWQPDEWQPVPIMVLAGSSGLAIFSDRGETIPMQVKNAFHFAFRAENLDTYRTRLRQRGISFFEEDHVYFQSIYLRDPDGYRVEITALSKPAKD